MLMSLTPRITPITARRIAAACGTGVLLLGATACGSSNNDDPQNASGQPTNSAEGGPDSTGQQGFPGADGKVAAVDGSTAQVQSRTDGQVAVTWNSSTTFTKQISASLDDVKTGTCVMVQPGDGSASSDDQTKVSAGTVRITEKVDGSCTGGLRAGGPGAGGPQFNGSPPTGELPEGAQPPGNGEDDGKGRPQFRGLGGAFGEVTAVSATGFTVKSTIPRFDDSGGTPSTEETTVTVTVTGDTTYTTTGTGSAADVKTGECMRAEGSTDNTGAITAKTIAMSPATDGECGGTVFRRNGPGGSNGGNGGGDVGAGTDSTQES